jgi:hypothetical protein
VIREEQPDGGVSKTKDFYLISSYYVSLYDSSGELVKRNLLEKSDLYTSRPTLGALITIQPNLARATEKIVPLAREVAAEYHRMFYPTEVTAGYKKLYTGKIFTESNEMIKNSSFDKAIEMLEQLPYTSQSSMQKKIRHNISVAKYLKEYYAHRR